MPAVLPHRHAAPATRRDRPHPVAGWRASGARIRGARVLTGLVIALSAVAAGAGLVVPGLYRDPAAIVPAMRGQDLLTLLALPGLSVAAARAARGSTRAVICWLALLGYVLYTYTGAAFAYAFNALFPVYVALFSLSIAAMIALVRAIDPPAVAAAFSDRAPRRAVAIALWTVAALVAIPEVAQIVPFYTTGAVPEIITRAGSPTSFIYVLDLGVVLPLCVLAALWVQRRRPWGYVLAGCMLVKGAAMGLALMSMTWFTAKAGMPIEVGLTIVYATIAVGSLAMSWWLLRACRS